MKNLVYTLFIIVFFVSCGTENKPTYTLTTTVSPSEGGTISPSSGEYSEGEVVELRGTPSSDGWRFIRWEGDWVGEINPVNLGMTRSHNVVGIFQKRDFPLVLTIEGEGTVEERVVQQKSTEYPYETVVELTPIPSLGWSFVEWGGDLSGSEVPKLVTINEEKNVTVRFTSPIFVGENGITIMCPNSEIGHKSVINGEIYEVVDRNLLIQRRDEGSDLTRVCVSNVTDMRSMFSNSQFNQPIGNWDVSSVTDMERMFSGGIEERDTSPFNQPIGNWDVSNVTNMSSMFLYTKFNQPIGDWDVSSVTDMSSMFSNSQFNQPIVNWDVSNVTNMSELFKGTPRNRNQFNQPIRNWDVGSVTNMSEMFSYSEFNQPIGDWDVSSVTDMSSMFLFTRFNQPIGNWDVSSVEGMSGMFRLSQFNQPIGDWNVSKVENMSRMFSNSLPFNQPIGNWDVSKVTDMSDMFNVSQFNQPIGNWDVSSVTTIDRMFWNSQFNQPINRWCVTKITSRPFGFSTNSPLTSQNKPIWGTCPTP